MVFWTRSKAHKENCMWTAFDSTQSPEFNRLPRTSELSGRTDCCQRLRFSSPTSILCVSNQVLCWFLFPMAPPHRPPPGHSWSSTRVTGGLWFEVMPTGWAYWVHPSALAGPTTAWPGCSLEPSQLVPEKWPSASGHTVFKKAGITTQENRPREYRKGHACLCESTDLLYQAASLFKHCKDINASELKASPALQKLPSLAPTPPPASLLSRSLVPSSLWPVSPHSWFIKVRHLPAN